MSHCHIEHILEEQGLRKTKDRHRLLELFEEERAWSASQLASELTSDLSTIYRNLKHFEATGLIAPVFERRGESVYEQTGRSHHDHAVCESCDVSRCIPCPVTGSKPHLLQLLETCPSCN